MTTLGVTLAACAGPSKAGPSPPPLTHSPSRAGDGRSPSSTPPAPRPAPAASNVDPQPSAPPGLSPYTLPELLKEIEAAYRGGDYARGLTLVQKALQLNERDVSSLDRIGSIYFVLGRYGEALTIWRRALPFERNLKRRRELENSIAVARRSLGIAVDEGAPDAAPAPVPAPPPRRPPPAAPPAPPDPAELARLYKKGVKYYAEGEYLQAAATFLHILDLDPGNPEATKALQRLKLEPSGSSPAP